MNNDTPLRALSTLEISTLLTQGCYAEDWAKVRVCADFTPSQLRNATLEGEVHIGSGAMIISSTVKNYILAEGARIEGVTRMECRAISRFGNGVSVATINECAGRTIKIYDSLTAQVAYVWAMFRHREEFTRAMSQMVDSYASKKSSTLARVGAGSSIVGVKILREVNIAEGVSIEGASYLENGTICSGAYIGADVKAKEFIIAEGAKVDTGATIERCFIGECAKVACGFSAVDSLIFANSHLENGEAASIFAAPYTVSHHKSSLLIAGLFSFFNAGSGSNQSNHLFKTGAVHQAIHPRGCKFASGAYIMAPAIEGAYTMVKGHHTRHHDTLAFPFSYLIDDGDRSMLLPGANLTSYGTMRDIEKWGARDARRVNRDVINFEEHNPYITSMMITAVNTSHTLQESDPTAEQYIWNRVIIKPAHLKRGLGLYNKAIAASIGAMLEGGNSNEGSIEASEWIDAAGQYITLSCIEEFMTQVVEGKITSPTECQQPFAEFARHYTYHAYNYAHSLLTQLLGHTPSPEEITSTITAAQESRDALVKMALKDKTRDCDMSMAVGYGIHSQGAEEEYRIVRGLL